MSFSCHRSLLSEKQSNYLQRIAANNCFAFQIIIFFIVHGVRPTDERMHRPIVVLWMLLTVGAHAGIVASGNAWERRSQSYFDSGNGI